MALEADSSSYSTGDPNLDARRRLALAMIQQGSDTSPIASPWQGLARIAQSMIGGYNLHSLGQQNLDSYNAYAKSLGGDPTQPTAPAQPLTPAAAPDTQPTDGYMGVGSGLASALPKQDPLTDFVKQREGLSLKAYPDGAQTSIGYGTRANPGETAITPDEASARLGTELGKARMLVQAQFPNLSPKQEDALTDLTYNAGNKWMGQTLGAAVKAGNWPLAERLFQQYDTAGGKELPGLVSRRAAMAPNLLDTGAGVATAASAAPGASQGLGASQGANSQPPMGRNQSVDASGQTAPASLVPKPLMDLANAEAARGNVEGARRILAGAIEQSVQRSLTPQKMGFGDTLYTVGPDGQPHFLNGGAGGPGDIAIPGNMQLHGADYVNSVTDAGSKPLVSEAMSIVNGGEKMPDTMSNRTPKALMLQKMVYQIDPTFTPAIAQERATTLKELGKAEPNSMGGQITSGRAALGHMAELADSAAGLHNSSGYTGSTVNFLSTKLSPSGGERDSAVTGFRRNRQTFAGESVKFITGGNGGEGDRQASESNFGENAGPGALAEALEASKKQMLDKFDSLQRSIDSSLGSTGMGKQVLDDAAKKQLARIDQRINELRAQQEGKSVPSQAGSSAKAQGGNLPTLGPADAAKLPPNTPFIGLDGVRRVTHG